MPFPRRSSAGRGSALCLTRESPLTGALTPGETTLCHGCRRPLTPRDREGDSFEAGVSCPYCIESLTAAQRAAPEERFRRVSPGRGPGETHLAPQRKKDEKHMIDAQPLAGERLLITGPSSGLGAHFARRAVAAGSRGRGGGPAGGCAGRPRGRAPGRRGDGGGAGPGRYGQRFRRSAFFRLERTFAHGAGEQCGHGPGVFSFLDLDEAGWDATINTNLKGTWLMARAAASAWQEAGQGATSSTLPASLPFASRRASRPTPSARPEWCS